jgi:hypothetical protein
MFSKTPWWAGLTCTHVHLEVNLEIPSLYLIKNNTNN